METLINIPLPKGSPLSSVDIGSGAMLVGGALREFVLGFDPIRHPDVSMAQAVASTVQSNTGFRIPRLTQDLIHAYEAHKPLREIQTDIDVLVAEADEVLHPLTIATTGAINDLETHARFNPRGASFSDGKIKLDLTSANPSPFGAHTNTECGLSIDLVAQPIEKVGNKLVVKADEEFLRQPLILRIVGDMSNMDTERAIATTVGFISKSQLEKQGERIMISFGETDEKSKSNRELLMLSLSLILLNKDKYQKYYDRLLYSMLNWDRLDHRVHEIIILAFQFVNYKIDNVS